MISCLFLYSNVRPVNITHVTHQMHRSRLAQNALRDIRSQKVPIKNDSAHVFNLQICVCVCVRPSLGKKTIFIISGGCGGSSGGLLSQSSPWRSLRQWGQGSAVGSWVSGALLARDFLVARLLFAVSRRRESYAAAPLLMTPRQAARFWASFPTSCGQCQSLSERLSECL